MKYRTRPGIVLNKICGVWLLIPTREAAEFCPSVTRLTLPAVLAWGVFKKGSSQEDLIRILSILTHDDNAAKEMSDRMIQDFLSKNLIVPAEDEP